MTTLKQYITVQPLMKMNVEVKTGKNKYERVLFSNGGTTSGGAAIYTTADEAIQKALESSPMFGVKYKLRYSHQEQETIIENSGEVNPKIKDENPGEGQPKGGDENPKEYTFSTYNELRDWLVNEHDCTPAQVRTTEEALAKAAELKLNVTLTK